MPTPNPRKHQAINPDADAFSWQSINTALLSINDAVPVANTTERNALATTLTGLGSGPTTARPLLVYRADAPLWGRYEWTTDGSTWRVLAREAEHVMSGVVMGTARTTQPVIHLCRTLVLNTDANGDTVILTGAELAGGGVGTAKVVSVQTFQILGAYRGLSGNLVARLWNGSTLAASTSISANVEITYWNA